MAFQKPVIYQEITCSVMKQWQNFITLEAQHMHKRGKPLLLAKLRMPTGRIDFRPLPQGGGLLDLYKCQALVVQNHYSTDLYHMIPWHKQVYPTNCFCLRCLRHLRWLRGLRCLRDL